MRCAFMEGRERFGLLWGLGLSSKTWNDNKFHLYGADSVLPRCLTQTLYDLDTPLMNRIIQTLMSGNQRMRHGFVHPT